ncbi:hypothetical protein [Amycolatopsis eburnea]|uniref:Uncharacterized protein n=1 Tax=Amycolatopsis eburnea TaxID=2267691 RepID=A0A3R9DY30_9PSEU|nr:hypothetical protein [Amycolatopsis eburnea]RSD10308.1 hypothetical protein EIY87_36105 [Amycolatopsis eburnea]
MTTEDADVSTGKQDQPDEEPAGAQRRLETFKRRVEAILTKVAEPRPGESGWYIDSGEGRAYSAGAEVLKGADVSIGPNNRRFALAIEAIKQLEVPPGSTAEQIMETATKKYLSLMAAEKTGT